MVVGQQEEVEEPERGRSRLSSLGVHLQGEWRNLPGSVKETDDVEASGIRSSWKRRNQKGDRMASSERHANNDGNTGKNATYAGAW